MPRPPKKKIKSKPSKEEADFEDESQKNLALPEDSSDDANDLASLMKLRGIAKIGHQASEIFEKKCLQLVESTMEEVEAKLNSHEEHLAKLFESVEQINEEIEPSEDEVMVDKIINKRFDVEINYLSNVLTDLTSEQHADSEGMQRISEFLEDLNLRQDQVVEFSRRMNTECKKGFRMYCENNKLLGDSQNFKEKYKALMKEAL